MMFCSVWPVLLSLLTAVSTQSIAAAAPVSAPYACVDTAPDCAAICNNQPGNVADACSLQTPIGNYLR